MRIKGKKKVIKQIDVEHEKYGVGIKSSIRVNTKLNYLLYVILVYTLE